ncbi:hypothetical protein GE09DRAFT_1117128 [Coniochaeta sp. 2T2.1]|nr:hypothetical protein GE09DRAFT_1117128 [Coniochaeta sp. 2T2.1]
MDYSESSHLSPGRHQPDEVANSSHHYASWWEEDAAVPANYFDPTSMLAGPGASPAGIDSTTAADGAQLDGTRSRGSSSNSNSGDTTCRGGSPQDEAGGSQQGSGRRGRKPLTADQIKRRREQNRRSQKNFRLKKDGRIAQLEHELQETTRHNELLEQHICTLRAQIPAAARSQIPGSWTHQHGDVVGAFEGGSEMMTDMSTALGEHAWLSQGGVTLSESDAFEWDAEGGVFGGSEYGGMAFDVARFDTFGTQGVAGRHHASF